MTDDPHTLQCSEVWGGNDDADRVVVMPGLVATVLSRPHGGDAGGGDIHYLSSCATGRITRVLIADVAGHGKAVSDLALRLRSLMRRYVNFVDQTRLAARINQEFGAMAEEGRFATAIVATYWAPTAELDITNAGHPPPLRYEAVTGRWTAVRFESGAGDIPLGVLEGTTYGRSHLRLAVGDLLLMYTDALVEACEPGGGQLGEGRLLELATAADAGRPEGFVDRLYAGLRGFAGGDLGDDATMLLLRPDGTAAPKGSLLLGLRVSLQIAWEAVVSAVRGTGFARPEVRRDNLLGAWVDRFNRR